MSEIIRLNISNVRNIQALNLPSLRPVNVLFGANGTGKTSILESIHVLATGKSFRSSKVDPLINHVSEQAVVYAELANGCRVGLSKKRRENQKLHLQDQPQRNWENVARLLPVQLLDSNSFQLLEGGPRARRKYLDWGVFHVEHSFLDYWRRSRKCLANRNFLLRQRKLDIQQLSAWDVELGEASLEVDRARSDYFASLVPQFGQVYAELVGAHAEQLSISYSRGWGSDRDLVEVLSSTVNLDSKYGSTQNGPHRAELDIRIGRNRAADVLSRGQQKLLVCALKIAQGDLLSKALGQKCIYLVDDLPAELDIVNRTAVLKLLRRQGGQLFLTAVEKDALNASLPIKPEELAMFHVEHGTITT